MSYVIGWGILVVVGSSLKESLEGLLEQSDFEIEPHAARSRNRTLISCEKV